MYTADHGKSWNKVLEYNRSTHTVWLVSSSNEIADTLYFSVEDFKNNTRVVYKLVDCYGLVMKTIVETQSMINHVQPEDTLPQMDPSVLPLVQELCNVLRMENIDYCHWKSNNMLERSANGDNDLDLLISRADGSRFTEILFRLGFKQAHAPGEKQMPGVLDYYGYDEQAEKWVHVHAHYQLIMGHDMTKNFRLALERPYLESAVQGELFRVPSVEFEFIILVIRMILKHSTLGRNPWP